MTAAPTPARRAWCAALERAFPGLAVVAVVACPLFLVGVLVDSFALRLACKPWPHLALLAWLAASAPAGDSRDGRYRRLVFGAVTSCMVADFLLEFRARFFVAGMAVFGLGHLAFTAALVTRCRRAAIARAVPVCVYLAAVYVHVEPGLAAMRAPVVAYMAVIGVMMWRAAAGLGGSGGEATRAEWLALAGAGVFGFSDTLIALDRFHAPIAGARIAIILTYWTALWLLAASAVVSSDRRTA